MNLRLFVSLPLAICAFSWQCAVQALAQEKLPPTDATPLGENTSEKPKRPVLSDTDKQGYLALVNASGMASPVKVMINGSPLLPDGLENGDFSGGLVVPAGDATLRFIIAGIDPLETAVTSPQGASILMGLSSKTEVDPKTKQPIRKLVLTPVGGEAQDSTKGYRLWVKNFLDKDMVPAQLGAQTLYLKRDEIQEVQGYNGKPFMLGMRGNAGKRFNPSEPGSLVAALVPDDKNGAFAIMFRINKYSTP